MPFFVIKFKKDESLAAVPCCWVTKDECYWPPQHVPNKKIEKLINTSSQPSEEFKKFKINILRKFDDINEAHAFVKKIENGYSSTEGKRKIFTNRLSDFEYDDHTDTLFANDTDLSDEEVSLLQMSKVPNLKINNKRSNPMNKENEKNKINSSLNKEKQKDTITSPLNKGKQKSISPIININRTNMLSPFEVNSQLSQSFSDYNLSDSDDNNIARPLNAPTPMGNSINVKINEETNWTIETVVKNQMKILEILKEHTVLLNNLTARNKQGEEPDDDNIPKLPLILEENFNLFEEYLTNRDNFKKMSNYLNCFICNETNKSIYAIFNKIFDDQLAAKFNYCGTAPKQPIKNTQTEKLIYYTVRIHHQNCNRETFKDYAMKWLKNAPLRLKRKNN